MSRRKQKYNGCELSSPIYRQVVKEMREKKHGLPSTKTKKGKRSLV